MKGVEKKEEEGRGSAGGDGSLSDCGGGDDGVTMFEHMVLNGGAVWESCEILRRWGLAGRGRLAQAGLRKHSPVSGPISGSLYLETFHSFILTADNSSHTIHHVCSCWNLP